MQIPHDSLQTNSLHHEEEKQNIYSNKTYTPQYSKATSLSDESLCCLYLHYKAK